MIRQTVCFSLFALLVIGLTAPAVVADEAGSPGYLMRFADIGGGQIVFTYEDDLWLVPETGGDARRITSAPGVERYARFSPDGSQLAFTGEYDGGYDVYVMDVAGGEPRRLTFHPSGGVVLDWCPDGTGIMFRSTRTSPSRGSEVYRIPVDGGMPMKLPLDRASLASVAPDRSAVAYNRIGRQRRNWKRYEGGMAQDIWVATFATGEIKKITEWTGTDNYPMWVGDHIYFLSDREDGTLNVYGYNTQNERTERLTHFTDYDIKFPAAGKDQIVFQQGGTLQVLNLTSGQTQAVDIRVPSDRRHVRTQMITPSLGSGSFTLSPAGQRVLIEARGEILNLPADEGDAVNLTRTSGSREKNAVWSPDGRWIAFTSDKSGEECIYLTDQNGQGPWRQLTDGFFSFMRHLVWSPDSKYLLFSDKFMNLNLVDVEKGEVKQIAHSDWDDAWERWGIMDYAWSPDSQWITYTSNTGNMNEIVYLYDLDKEESYPVTDDMVTSWSPSFSTDGQYLYFLSNRTFNPIMGRQDQTHVFLKMAKPYVVILQDGQRSPFYTEDVVVVAEDEEDDDEASKDKTIVDLDGLQQRILVCDNVSADNYFRLEAVDGGFLMLRKPELEFLKYQNVDDHTNDALELMKYDLAEASLDQIMEGVANYHLSADGSKMIYRAGRAYGVVDTGSSSSVGDGAVDLGAINLRIDRLAEFQQIFDEAWRVQRDWFYDKNMHGVDWDANYRKYSPFVPGCGARGDLNYLIGEMIAELNIGHTYIYGGDGEPQVPYYSAGLLGASFVPEPDSDYYKITDIVRGVSWDPRFRSPLLEPGSPVVEGSYLIAIDGEEIPKGANVYERLVDKAGQMVTLTVNDKPRSKGAQTFRVRTLRRERGLRYRAWVDNNLDYVTEKSDGRIGYLHVPDMGENGLVEFGRSYYPQATKQALIFDERYNGGGFTGDMIIDRLERRLWSMTQPREGKGGRDPERVFHGPLVVLINEDTGSNGEFFAEAIKRKGLGTVIGMRTWGGSIGIEPHQGLMDGATTTPPQFGLYGLDGTWPIEGWGVEPHIVIMNMPAEVVAGQDTQLDKAIEFLLDQLANSGGKWDIPDAPAYPDKSRPNMSRNLR